MQYLLELNKLYERCVENPTINISRQNVRDVGPKGSNFSTKGENFFYS